MTTEQLRNMIENQSLESYPNNADRIEVIVKTDKVTDLIARTLSVEYNNACCAEYGLDYFFKASDYVHKQYCALMAISNPSWISYIASVEIDVVLRTKMYIAENHEYLEADEAHRVNHMEDINKKFYDFVFAFFTLQHIMKKTCDVNLDIEK